MKRIVMMLTVALVMAAMMAATALPVFAVASENASCRGQGISTLATGAGPGAVGQATSTAAHSYHEAGEPYGKAFVSQLAQLEPCPF